eukprot:4094668-Pyramimonas_sp.AAC.1
MASAPRMGSSVSGSVKFSSGTHMAHVLCAHRRHVVRISAPPAAGHTAHGGGASRPSSHTRQSHSEPSGKSATP